MGQRILTFSDLCTSFRFCRSPLYTDLPLLIAMSDNQAGSISPQRTLLTFVTLHPGAVANVDFSFKWYSKNGSYNHRRWFRAQGHEYIIISTRPHTRANLRISFGTVSRGCWLYVRRFHLRTSWSRSRAFLPVPKHLPSISTTCSRASTHDLERSLSSILALYERSSLWDLTSPRSWVCAHRAFSTSAQATRAQLQGPEQ